VSFVDKPLRCRECGREFMFTAGEQEFYQLKGLMNTPSRCPECRAARKAQRGSGYDSQPAGGAGFGARAPREMHTVVCAECGVETQVPFLPRGDRPVYCSTCFDRVRYNR
jgi:CxxC-x17-CxxC domain-containing protein